MLAPKNNRVIVELSEVYDKEIKVGNVIMKLDNAFRKLWNAVQEATVVACEDGLEVEVGDTVYVHHFVSEDERKIPVKGKEYRWLEYRQIYCRMRKGVLKTLSDFVLIEPMQYDGSKFNNKTESGLVIMKKAGTEYIDRVGAVYDLGDVSKQSGLKKGDKVLFNKNCEYMIKVDKKKLYRMELRDIITVIGDDVEFTV